MMFLYTDQIYTQHGLPVGLIHNPCIVHHYVQLPKAIHCLLEHIYKGMDILIDHYCGILK